jgi:hypothetical protein
LGRETGITSQASEARDTGLYKQADGSMVPFFGCDAINVLPL